MKKTFLALLVSALMTFAACTPQTTGTGSATAANKTATTAAATQGEVKPGEVETTYPIQVTDGLGQAVTLQKEPERIISLAPNVTEILFALGLGDKVVGTSEFSDYPAEAAKIETLGGAISGTGGYDMERIAELEPDLIVTNGAVEGLRESMKSADIAVAGYFPQSMDKVMDQIVQIAELTNTQETGSAIVADMKARRAAVAASVAGLAQPTVFYEVWGDPLMVAGKGSFINEMIAIAGGIDIAGDSQLYSTYDVEQLIEQNPEIYLINDGDPALTPQTLAQRPGYGELKAVTENRVLTINADLISRPGPRLIDGLEALADLLHPDRKK